MKGSSKTITKRALFGSVLACLLCVTLLVGTTFAWFTDTAVSKGNRIASGSLDMELSFKTVTNGTPSQNWEDVNNKEDILDPNALYEPGYLSLTYFKVKNAGTLAFKYQLALLKESERSSVNVRGDEFKVSDHLVFRFVKLTDSTAITKTQVENGAAVSREDTLALIGQDRKLGFENATMVNAVLTKQTADDTASDIIALVVYMPETVGNEAMYDYDHDAPELKLDIRAVATQYSSETDSFDQYYDQKAYSPDWNVYQYIKGDIANGLSAYDSNGTEVVNVTGHSANVTMTVYECNEPANMTVVSGTTYKSYDISVKDDSGSTPGGTYTVKMFVGTGLPNLTLYHNGTPANTDPAVSDISYDSTTGYVTFKTTSFSPFTAASTGVGARIGETYYQTVNEAFDAIKSGSAENGSTIVLTAKMNTVNNSLRVISSKYAVLDLNGCTIVANINNAIQNEGTLTIKDSSPKGTGLATNGGSVEMDTDSDGTLTFINNTGTLNIEDGKISSVVNNTVLNARLQTIYNNSGVLNISGGEIIAKNEKHDPLDSGAVYGIYNSGSPDKVGKLNMTGGTLSVSAVYGSAYGINNWLTTDVNISNAKINVALNGSQCYGIYVASKTNPNNRECKSFILDNVTIKCSNSVPSEMEFRSNYVKAVSLADKINIVSIKNVRIEAVGKDCAASGISDSSYGMENYEINADSEKNTINVVSNRTADGINISDYSTTTAELEKLIKNTKIVASVKNSTTAKQPATVMIIRNNPPIRFTIASCDMYAESDNYSANGIWNHNSAEITFGSGNTLELVAPNGSASMSYNVNFNTVGSYSVNTGNHKVWSN